MYVVFERVLPIWCLENRGALSFGDHAAALGVIRLGRPVPHEHEASGLVVHLGLPLSRCLPLQVGLPLCAWWADDAAPTLRTAPCQRR